jgi:hypothetical protein
MMNVSNRFPLLSVYRRMNHLVIVGVLAVVGVGSGFMPQISPALSGLSTSSVAVAQSPDPLISNYARAALRVEQLRQRMYTEAKEKLGGNVPPNVCSQQPPPTPVQGICADFMKQSKNIIVEYLTIAQFNDLTRRKDSDPALQQQIQDELLRIQKSSP